MAEQTQLYSDAAEVEQETDAPRGAPSGGTPRSSGAAAPAAAILELLGVTHRFGDFVAIDDVSITARQGEFLTILGESGSGKTTLLRVISGLEKPSRIEALRIAGRDVIDVSAADRNCTTVFQHYALFPHMTVGENVEYGLKVRGIKPSARQERALEALNLVRLADKYDRRAHQLSGGERQRVALARALVIRPAILLLDEPLGALDEKLRLAMQVELLQLQRKLGTTFVYITHSQEEALTMSDRVVLMRHGTIMQEGPPRDLFDRPKSRFVADFMGVENLLEGRVKGIEDGHATVEVGGYEVRGLWCAGDTAASGSTACVGVRAERIFLGTPGAAAGPANRLTCRPGTTIYKGKYLDQSVETDIGEIKARVWDSHFDVSQIESVWWAEKDCMVMSA